MSGSGLPYRLRPNKFVDRELFAELVSMLIAEKGAETYAYISMGGNHLTDHLAIYRRAGVRKLYSFDYDDDVVNRQKFNAPFDGIWCETHPSSELPGRLDGIITRFGVQNVIVWLDYTDAGHMAQLGEVEALSKSLDVGDVLRVTMNVDFATLHKQEAQLSKEEKALEIDEKRAALMRKVLGGYFPRTITRIGQDGLVGALADSVGRACEMGLQGRARAGRPIPLLTTEYRDSAAMMTVTMLICDGRGHPSPPLGWSYLPPTFNHVERILAPDLSSREKLALDREMHRSAEDAIKQVGFPLELEAVRSYARFHRFYPTFHTTHE